MTGIRRAFVGVLLVAAGVAAGTAAGAPPRSMYPEGTVNHFEEAITSPDPALRRRAVLTESRFLTSALEVSTVLKAAKIPEIAELDVRAATAPLVWRVGPFRMEDLTSRALLEKGKAKGGISPEDAALLLQLAGEAKPSEVAAEKARWPAIGYRAAAASTSVGSGEVLSWRRSPARGGTVTRVLFAMAEWGSWIAVVGMAVAGYLVMRAGRAAE